MNVICVLVLVHRNKDMYTISFTKDMYQKISIPCNFTKKNSRGTEKNIT